MEYETVPRKKKGSAQVQKEFIKNWTGENQEVFEEVMEQIREKDPRAWAKLYIEHEKMIVPRVSDINHNFGVDKDLQDLMLLGKTAAVPHQQLALTDNVEQDLDELVHYEEIAEPKYDLLSPSKFDEKEEGELN